MKRITTTVICIIVLSMSALPLTAQTRGRRCPNRMTYETRQERYNRDARYGSQYDNNVDQSDIIYSDDGYINGDNRSVWEKHRDKISTAGGAVGGAVLGGIIGGKKGAIIGGIAGGVGAAIYTYKIRDKNGRF